MYTLKIRYTKYTKYTDDTLVDETTCFIPADKVVVHGTITDMSQMSAWAEGSYHDYRTVHENHVSDDNPEWMARLITVIHNDVSDWYLVSLAWLLGPDGKTIERLV